MPVPTEMKPRVRLSRLPYGSPYPWQAHVTIQGWQTSDGKPLRQITPRYWSAQETWCAVEMLLRGGVLL